MPVPGCKETLGARFSLGIHASFSRPGLADLTVRRNISLARGIHCCPEFISLAQPPSVYCEEHVCTYTYQTAQRLYINPLKTKRRLLYLKPQSVPRCKHFSSRL